MRGLALGAALAGSCGAAAAVAATPTPGPLSTPPSTTSPTTTSPPVLPPVAVVTPAVGTGRTHFHVHFAAPATPVIPSGLVIRRYVVTATARPQHGCVWSGETALPAYGATEQATLVPPRRSHGWCRGTFHGRVVLTQQPSCTGPMTMCAMFVSVVETAYRFHFRVK